MKRRAALAALLMVGLSACASMRRVEVGSTPNSTYAVDVYNSRSTTLTVSYTDGSGTHELGTVAAGQTQHFAITGNSGTSVTFTGTTSGGSRYTKAATLGTTSKVTL